MTWIIIGTIAVLLWAIIVFNGMVRLSKQADAAWSDIDVQLKRRHDLIPNVVETVKGYASHEKNVFIEVTEARTRAMAAGGPKEKGDAEANLAGSIQHLFAVAENYPQLRANENFMGLQKSLTEVEETLQNARRYYNAVIRDYNIKIGVFPNLLIAPIAGFKERDYFQLDSAEEAATPKVSMG
jgi:LemA protein